MESKEFVASVFRQLGTHSDKERHKDDYYATDPRAVKDLIAMLNKYNIEIPKEIVETSVGGGHIAKEFEKIGCNVTGYDIVDRGYPNTIIRDYLAVDKLPDGCMVIENPPFKRNIEFIKHSLSLIKKGQYICTFQKIQFLESQERKLFFEENPPKYVFVFSKRVKTYINGDMSDKQSSAMCFCWFVFQKGYKGDTVVKWI